MRVVRPTRDQSQGGALRPATLPVAHQEEHQASSAPTPAPEALAPAVGAQDDAAEWRDRALRLQADMDNFRKRQRRLAQDQIQTERQRLLVAFLRIVDDLERVLVAPGGTAEELRQGVELTHRAALQWLQKEGVELLKAGGQPFDPNWHEAVATIPHDGRDVAPGAVVQVLEPGYRLGSHLLRPAKVVVAA